MDDVQKDVAIRVFAEQAKKNYREWLAYRLFAVYMKSKGFPNVDAIIEDARRSPEFEAKCQVYDRAIDSKIPPSESDRLHEEVRKALEALPTDGFPIQ
ncbi:MAG TPA: hypothetical protein VFC39_10105 [Acidobacteriaceae bacterium]|nr:hypothetical protein [Acidobacteriaceae bacterium]